MSFWKPAWTRRAELWVNYRFKPEQVPGAAEPRAIQPNGAYVNIWLKSARVVNVRAGLKRFYGAVHGRATLTGAAEERDIEINTVIAPDFLKDIDAKNLDRVASINHRLLGPVAYSGSDVTVEVGLFSIKEADLVAPYLAMLQTISSVAGVGFISSAAQLAGPIKDGLDAILSGGGDNVLEIGLARTFQPMETGYYLVMRATPDDVDCSTLRVNPDSWSVLSANGKPLKDFPYILLEVSATAEKYDWGKIPELRRQYELVKGAIVRGDAKEAEAAQIVFRRLALTARELIRPDAERLAKLVKDEVDAALGGPVGHSEHASPRVKDFEELNLYPAS